MQKFYRKSDVYGRMIGNYVFTLYVTAIIAAHLFLVSSTRLGAVRSIFIAALLAIIISPLALTKARTFFIPVEKHPNKPFYKTLFYGLPLLVLLIYYLAYYPGGFPPDSISQYEQALTNHYNDWHPVLATLISFKLPLLLTHGWIGSVILFQLIWFAAAIGYSCSTVEKYVNSTAAFTLLAFMLLNPQLGNMAMAPWKDSLFALATLLLATCSARIYFTYGRWLEENFHTVILILLLAVTTLLRHNAILFTAPFLVGLFFFSSRKRAFAILGAVLALCFLIKGFLFPILHVQAPPNRQAEAVGLPMSVISAVAAHAPDALEEQDKQFIFSVAQPEVFPAHFSDGYNDIKYLPGTNNQAIEDYGIRNVLNTTIRCFKHAPIVATKALLKLTAPAISVLDDEMTLFTPAISPNNYNIQQQGIPALHQFFRTYTRVCTVLFAPFFVFTGIMHLLLLLAVCAKCTLRRYWKNVWLILPIFTYNFGTMLLLSGKADAVRLYYYTFLVAPLLLILLFSRKKVSTRYSSFRRKTQKRASSRFSTR